MTLPAHDRTHRAPAAWAAWMDAFADITENLSTLADKSCPNGDARTLRAVFVGPPGLGAASGFFWCDTCLHGVSVSRMGVPAGADVIPIGQPQPDWPVVMPEYTLVWPQDEDQEED